MKRQTLFISIFVFCFLAPALILAKDAPVTPWKAKGEAKVIDIQFADPNAPISGATSTFDGRCSVPSDYVVTFWMVAEATHLGRMTVSV
jgi:hypothetical protein